MRFGHLIAATAAACIVTSVYVSEASAATCYVRKFKVTRKMIPYMGTVNLIETDFDVTSGGTGGPVDGSIYYKMPPQTWWSYLAGPIGGEPAVAPGGTVNVVSNITDLPRTCPCKLNITFQGLWLNDPGDQASP
jgi:hypothetical protein